MRIFSFLSLYYESAFRSPAEIGLDANSIKLWGVFVIKFSPHLFQGKITCKIQISQSSLIARRGLNRLITQSRSFQTRYLRLLITQSKIIKSDIFKILDTPKRCHKFNSTHFLNLKNSERLRTEFVAY